MSNASDKLYVLSTLSRRLSQGVDLEVFLKEASDKIAFAMDAARVTIYLLDKKRDELWSKVAHLKEIKEIRLKVGQGVAGHVAATGEILNISKSYSDDRFFSGIDEKTGFKTDSQLCAPMRDHLGVILGVVQVLNKNKGSFDIEDEQFLEILTGQLAILIENTSLYQKIKAARQRDTRVFPLKAKYNNIIGDSMPMQIVFSHVDKIAPTDVTVLIRGNSGTGKEMIARTIHINSNRKDKPFIKIDCTSLPETLLENELFGHEQGAYTGASRRMPGKIAAALDGTLFIDEIGDLALPMQKRLLRVFQDRQYEPLGSTKSLPVKARILTATNRNLEKLVQEKLFREDLYFRIKVAQITLPSLQKRGESDIISLTYHFLHMYNRKYQRQIQEISETALHRLTAHNWPGNVRELEHCIESAVVLSETNILTENDLPIPARLSEQSPGPAPLIPLQDMEKKHITNVLKAVKGNKSEAARILEIGRNTLARKIESYQIP